MSEFTGSHAAAEGVADSSGPTQHRTTQLLGVCREVNYLTGPPHYNDRVQRTTLPDHSTVYIMARSDLFPIVLPISILQSPPAVKALVQWHLADRR